MKLSNAIQTKISLLCIIGICCIATPSVAEDAVSLWDNPEENMTSGSLKPGYTQLFWSRGSVLPIKMKQGLITMVNLPNGEQIADIVTGDDAAFSIDATQGQNSFMISPQSENTETNLIVTGQSGNRYIFLLRGLSYDSDEITYSQVDVALDGNASVSGGTKKTATGSMGSIFKKSSNTSSVVGVDGEDYGWIKTVKIDPSEFRFDLDIFVPNPDDYVIAPERVWRDRIFTYIDFGDKVIAMTQRPVVSLLVEGGESPVSFRTDGEDGRLLIVEAVGDLVLRSGQRIVCIKKRAKPFLVTDTASVMALAEANVAQSMMSSQSLNNVAYADSMSTDMINYTGTPVAYSNQSAILPYATYQLSGNTMQMVSAPNMQSGSGNGMYMMPTERNTAGAYLPRKDVPLITSNQTGIAVELKSDTSVKALDEYWNKLLEKFSGDEGNGLLTPYKDSAFFSVDEEGVGDLGSGASAARTYRLRIGTFDDISTAQALCDKLLKFSGTSCSVIRMQ